jgi:hypothetical protein
MGESDIKMLRNETGSEHRHGLNFPQENPFPGFCERVVNEIGWTTVSF